MLEINDGTEEDTGAKKIDCDALEEVAKGDKL